MKATLLVSHGNLLLTADFFAGLLPHFAELWPAKSLLQCCFLTHVRLDSSGGISDVFIWSAGGRLDAWFPGLVRSLVDKCVDFSLQMLHIPFSDTSVASIRENYARNILAWNKTQVYYWQPCGSAYRLCLNQPFKHTLLCSSSTAKLGHTVFIYLHNLCRGGFGCSSPEKTHILLRLNGDDVESDTWLQTSCFKASFT